MRTPILLRAPRRRSALAALAALLSLPAGLTAQAVSKKPDSTRVLPLDEIVVTVTRTGHSAREAPANVTVLTRAAIEASAAKTVQDLLRTIPGFTSRDHQVGFGSHPSRQTPVLRGAVGTSAGRTLVLVDGVPIDDPYNGWVAWAIVPLELVERIEVVRGGAAGTWGSRAMGGVINIITRRPTESGLELTGQGGNLSTYRAGTLGTLRSGRFGITVLSESFGTDGFMPVPRAARAAIDRNVSSNHEMAFARIEYDPAPSLRLHVDGSYLDESRPNATPLRYTDTELAFVRAGAALATPDGSRWKLSLFTSAQWLDYVVTTESPDRDSEVPASRLVLLPSRAFGTGLEWSRSMLRSHEVTAGADARLMRGESEEELRFVNGEYTRHRTAGGEQLTGGLFIQDVFQPNQRWRVQASARLDLWSSWDGRRVETDLERADAVLVDSAYPAMRHTNLNYSIGVRHQTAGPVALRGSAYGAYRAPTLNEQYKPGREPGNIIIETNPTLTPETLVGAELGADYALGAAAILRATGFWSRIDDPIVETTIEQAGATGRNIVPCGFVPAGGICRMRRNLGRLRSAGAEASLEVHPRVHWTLLASYIWNPTEVVSSPADPEVRGKAFRGVAQHAATLLAAYANPGAFDLTVTGRYVGDRFDDDLNTLPLDAFFLLDARLARRLSRDVSAFLAAENLLGAEYEVSRAANGLLRIGGPRLVTGGLKVRL